MTQVPSFDDIKISLEKHAKVFDELLSLIPAKLYIHEENAKIISSKYMKNTKKLNKEQKKDEQRKKKAAQLDPDNHKTIQQLQAAKLEDAAVDASKTKKAKLSDGSDSDGTKMTKLSIDLEDNSEREQKQQQQQPSGEPDKDGQIKPMAPANQISELRKKLHDRIDQLRKKRNAPEDDASRSALLEKRMKRRKKTKEAKAQSKKAGKNIQEHVLGGSTPSSSSNGAPVTNGSSGEVKENIFYGTLTTGINRNKDKKGPGAKKQLAAVIEKKKKLDDLRKTDADKAARLEEKGKWGKALDLAKGEKVKDDPKLLRKTIRRSEQQKKKSGREWNDRTTTVANKIKERQIKRQDNLKARSDAKKMKKQGKSKKAIERVMKERKTAANPKKAGGKGKKARPGFEGKPRK